MKKIKCNVHEMRDGSWVCNTTYRGYDHAFYGNTPVEVKQEMEAFLNLFGDTGSYSLPQYYLSCRPSPPYPVINYCKNRIDYL